MSMTLYEGIIIANIAVSLWLAYKLGQAETAIEILYEGIAHMMLLEDKT